MTTPGTDRVQELEAKVAELTSLVDRLAPSTSSPAVVEDEAPVVRSSRRGMLKLAGAVAAGAAATVVVKGGQAAALDGAHIAIAETTETTSTSRETTAVVYTNTATPQVDGILPLNGKDNANIFIVRDTQDTSGPLIPLFDPSSSGYPAASAGYSYKTVANGMYGYTAMGGYGVVGLGAGSNACGVLARGTRANLSLYSNGAAPAARTTAYVKGDIIEDATGNSWICVADGTPGTWRKLAGPATAGAFHAITPTRVYDSRAAAPAQGVLGAGGNKTLSVKDGRDLTTGNVTVADLIPAGTTAITANITVVNTVGSGFLAVNPGGNTTVSAATVNWFASGQILNNGVNVTLNATRDVTVICGGGTGAQTDFVIDATGYYL